MEVRILGVRSADAHGTCLPLMLAQAVRSCSRTCCRPYFSIGDHVLTLLSMPPCLTMLQTVFSTSPTKAQLILDQPDVVSKKFTETEGLQSKRLTAGQSGKQGRSELCHTEKGARQLVAHKLLVGHSSLGASAKPPPEHAYTDNAFPTASPNPSSPCQAFAKPLSSPILSSPCQPQSL
eukprot:511156-Pelagomonas_calceolata.AAC.4